MKFIVADRIQDTFRGKAYKLCEIEHNPWFHGETIRFGSLANYREIEDKVINDQYEGLTEYHFHFDGFTFPRDELQKLLYISGGLKLTGKDVPYDNRDGFFPPGNYRRSIRSFGFVPKSSYAVTGQMYLNYEFPNSYVLSLSESLSSSKNFRYNSTWEIDLTKPNVLKRKLETYFHRKAKAKEIVLLTGGGVPFYGKVTVIVNILKVSYDKRARFYNRTEKSPARDIAALLWRAPYSKPEDFKSECEIRILVRFRSKHMALAVSEGHIDVSKHCFQQFVTDGKRLS